MATIVDLPKDNSHLHTQDLLGHLSLATIVDLPKDNSHQHTQDLLGNLSLEAIAVSPQGQFLLAYTRFVGVFVLDDYSGLPPRTFLASTHKICWGVCP